MTLRTRVRPPGALVLRDGRWIHWGVEIAGVVVFYVVYSWIRNANEGDAFTAFANARRVIDWQTTLGVYHEAMLQAWALGSQWFIVAANYFYGSLHFLVTIGAAVYCYRRFPNDYPLLRNTLAVATAVALIGFITFPLMPPRLLPPEYGFVDTLDRYPTFWSFSEGPVAEVSNQYAAMPSVHVAWAGWCALVLAPRVRRRSARTAAIAYPILTVAVIVVTGNHFVVDALGGAIVLAIGYAIARALTSAGRDPAPPGPRDVPRTVAPTA